MTAKQASKTSKDLRDQAKRERIELQKRGAKKLSEGLSIAKEIRSKSGDDIELLEKLGKLRKAGIITEREFQSKKKKILGRI